MCFRAVGAASRRIAPQYWRNIQLLLGGGCSYARGCRRVHRRVSFHLEELGGSALNSDGNRLEQIPFVDLKNVSHRYGSREVLSDINVTVGAGVLALLGPNGAGKTTLLSIMATVLAPRSGQVHVRGTSVDSERVARDSRRHIGLLPQRVPVVASYTALDMVRYSAWLRGVDAGAERRASKECLDRVGLADMADRRMKVLSGGMIQRVGLACALVGDPDILLLDEPTVGLDPAQRLEFRRILRSLENVAVVLSTHLVEDAAAIASALFIMESGRVCFEGTPRDLAAHGSTSSPGDSELERGYMSVLADAQAHTERIA